MYPDFTVDLIVWSLLFGVVSCAIYFIIRGKDDGRWLS